jgi:putative transposase
VVDRIEPLAAKHAEQWAAWGHRKIWGLLAADGVAASPSSVRRALAAADCCSRSATRPSAANSPRHAGRCSPTRRPDATACGRPTCCELESLAGGIWRMSGVVEDWAKTRLACPVTTTQGTRDVVAAIEAAIDQAETLLSHPLFQDVVDQATGELTPVVVVTDTAGLLAAAWLVRSSAPPEAATVGREPAARERSPCPCPARAPSAGPPRRSPPGC